MPLEEHVEAIVLKGLEDLAKRAEGVEWNAREALETVANAKRDIEVLRKLADSMPKLALENTAMAVGTLELVERSTIAEVSLSFMGSNVPYMGRPLAVLGPQKPGHYRVTVLLERIAKG